MSLVFIMSPILSFAECENSFIDKVRNDFGYFEELNESEHLVACKLLPNFPNQVIVAIARRQKGTEIGDSDTMGDYNLDISLINEKTGKTIAHRFFKQRFHWDGTRFDGIKVDSGKYIVSSGSRAFGIRAQYATGGFASNQTLSLFVVNGKNINEILSDADTNISFDNRYPSCRNDTRHFTRTVDIGKKKENGFYDLLVTEALVDSHEEDDKEKTGECISIDKKTVKKYTLHFDGKKYVVPHEMQYFDCRIC